MSKDEEDYAASLDEDNYDDDFALSLDEGADERLQALEMLFAGGDVNAAFGDPVTTGDYTVIPAAEVAVGGGFGSGWGYGKSMLMKALKAGADDNGSPDTSRGGGGGGGGGSTARPVAAIVIGPDGVSVRPILDYTKVGLAMLTALGAMWLAAGKMRRMAHMHHHKAG
jgi:uncharacterized spore protein YtfJ